MAKWGEGDPRWIVEERPDATNVNNWHWAEKNATPWSKDRLKSLFTDFEINQDGICCTIESVKEVDGEATVNNRKGKLIFFYEWNLTMEWSGVLPNDEKSHSGKINIPNLSEENDLSDVDITVTIEKSNNESEKLKTFMYNVGRDKIREVLGIYIKELKEEYSRNLILPTKGEEPLPAMAAEKKKINLNTVDNGRSSVNNSSSQSSLGCKLDVRSLKMKVSFHCSANDLYNCLTKQENMSAFTKSPAQVECTRGGEFRLYNGNVCGKFLQLVPDKTIKQTWRLKNWPSAHFSEVTMELEQIDSATELTLNQTGIPASEYDAMSANWHRYYWSSIKQTFGYGAPLNYAF